MPDPRSSRLHGRIAGAPISWGVCEVPGWGHQLPAPLVLSQMAALGLRATEFGPDGFLPAPAGERAEVLARHGLSAVGGFVPAVLHRLDHDPLPGVERALDSFGGARTLVLAAATGGDGYDVRPELDEPEWDLLLRRLDRIAARAAARGVTVALHPHVGTLVENAADVERVLDGSSVALCLDTGHLLIGGADPLALAQRAPGRIAHVHLKDVDAAAARRVRAGELAYSAAVAAGMYRPLGAGDVDVAGIVSSLEGAGYRGWYVLEQDTVLPAPGEGLDDEAVSRAAVADVRASVEHLTGLA
ncbi:sugar phosphate isomerase/epimerase [Kineococcus sp. NUM-3379]